MRGSVVEDEVADLRVVRKRWRRGREVYIYLDRLGTAESLSVATTYSGE